MFIKNLDDRSTLFRMISKNIILFHFFLLCILISFQFGKSEPLYYTCNISSTGGSEYRDNLESLLSTLTSNGTTPDGFSGLSNVTANAAAYGLFLCRGDVSPAACFICVTTARTEVLHLCPNQNRANVFYDDCMLRYSDRSIFSELDDDLPFYKFIHNATYHNMTLFSQVLSLTFDALARKAAYDSDFPGKKFAAQESNLTDFEKIFALAQCTPDLSYLDCYSCLRKAISQLPGCCTNSMGARFSYPSCNIRYDLYPFYQNPAPPDIDPPPPPDIDPPPPPDIDPPPPENNQGVVVGIAVSIGSGTLVFILGIFFWKRRSMKRHYFSKCLNIYDVEEDDIIVDPESLQYSLSEIETATNMFSMDNKIGQGGFGSVYKGILPNGQEVAVKRLSKSSGQGAAEFKNEIAVVAKLQHRNLVRLLGFCLEGNEKILVYEFVPRRSLDYFLFDFEKKGLLNWSRRRNIIKGIARGLMYLHEDSRLKIVHRDLKVGNILLDESMHPKIADFGMAKICGIHESEGNTTKIAGTLITGRKNSTFYRSEDSKDLISHAWRQWRGGTPLALLDPAIKESNVLSEVIQCVHIGLLCVEEDANKRPTMTLVVCMLNSTSVNLPIPHHPAILRDDPMRSVQAESREFLESINGASFTEPYPR